jgi:hypothetical protein
MKESFTKGFIYYILSSVFIGILFACYIQGDVMAGKIDAIGWLFFFTSCLSHAALLVLALFIVLFLPWALLRWHKVAAGLFVSGVALLSVVGFLNMQVYKIYRFHINGFVLNMLTGPNPGDIFQFDEALIVREGALLLLVASMAIALWWGAAWLAKHWHRRYGYLATGLLAGALLVANGLHVYGAFVVKPSILLTARLVPYYFPLSMSSNLEKMGFERNTLDFDESDGGDGELQYPLHPIEASPDSLKTNVVLILIDSWTRRALTEECMPRLWQMAHEEQYFANHVSCSNGTRYSVFGLFTGLQPYYWPAFQGSHQSPVLIDQLLAQGYDFRAYPSATLESPPFARVLFQHVPDLRVETPGGSPYQRDHRIAADLIDDLPTMAKSEKPFFAFAFFDMPHSLTWPENQPQHFKPAWTYANYAALNVDTPVEPFWNLYRNLCHATDSLVGEVLDALKQNGLYDNTLIFVTGDHGQEFNENHNNYWGHSSNFCVYQVGVPFIAHIPGKEARQYSHRTTHYDVVPTLMHDYLHVQNPISDYSAGHLLTDNTPRLWHFVGNELRYAFLLEKDTILTKEGAGWIEVTDAQMNPVEHYQIKPKEFERTIRDLNRFFK